MTDVPPETPLENVAEEVPPTEQVSPEEYTPDAPASEDTGTVFDSAGNTQQTPSDLAETDEDEDPDA